MRRWYHVDIDGLEADYFAGMEIEDLCERHNINAGQLQTLRVKYGIASRARVVKANNAPNADDERRSAASLALSPWVESRIKELREAKVLAEQKAEWEVAQVRMYRHHCSRI